MTRFKPTCLALGLVLGGCASPPAPTVTTLAAPASAPIVYSRPAAEHVAKIHVGKSVLSAINRRKLAALPRDPAPFGTRTLLVQRADTLQPPPWTTRITIFDTPEMPEAIVIELRGHATYGVSHLWLNDRLLFFRVWWGRIVSTDCVLDLESLKFLHQEDANHLGTVYPPETPRSNHAPSVDSDGD